MYAIHGRRRCSQRTDLRNVSRTHVERVGMDSAFNDKRQINATFHRSGCFTRILLYYCVQRASVTDNGISTRGKEVYRRCSIVSHVSPLIRRTFSL